MRPLYVILLQALISLAPAIALCAYIYVKDRKEKEPAWLLFTLFFAGAAAFFVAFFAQKGFLWNGYVIDNWHGLTGVFDNMFADNIKTTFGAKSLGGAGIGAVTYYEPASAEYTHALLNGFVGIAAVEEAVIWLVVFFSTFKSKHFNSFFDGIVYACFVSLGFAAVDNVRYAIVNGWDQLLLRAITSVPAYMFFGIIMGVCYTMWHVYGISGKRKKLYDELWLIASFVLPTLVHGVYSFMELIDTGAMKIAFYCFLAILYVVCFLLVRKMSRSDASDKEIAEKIDNDEDLLIKEEEK